jgi:hypothetical protein
MPPLHKSTLASLGKPKSVVSEHPYPYMPTDNCRPQPNSPFLRLPGEIRNKIYACAFDSATLCNKSPEPKYPGMFYVPADWKALPNATALLMTCRQVYLEAIYFKSDFHTIELHPALRITSLETVLGRMGCLQVRVFKMDTEMIDYLYLVTRVIYKKREWSDEWNLMVVFPNLEQIKVIDREGWDAPKFLRRAIEKGFALNPGCTKPKVVVYEPFFGQKSARFPKVKIKSGQYDEPIQISTEDDDARD